MGGMPLSELVQRITAHLAAPVVDEIGLVGLFDVVVEYERAGRPAAAQAGLNPTPNATAAATSGYRTTARPEVSS
jgi:hypothetical protein